MSVTVTVCVLLSARIIRIVLDNNYLHCISRVLSVRVDLTLARLAQDYSGSAGSAVPARARARISPLESSEQHGAAHPAMFGPNLHGDAAAGGATKIDLVN